MNLIDFIPIGKENKKTRQEIMSEVKITEEQFKKELAELKGRYIILFDDGYYLPESKEVYLEFIEKQNQKLYDTARVINLAYKKMEEI